MVDSHQAAVISGVIERPRLYQIVDSPLVRVCVVQGSTGSGKTTLLRSWAAHQERTDPIVWVSLSEAMTSRQAFWQHVANSAARLGSLTTETAAWVRERLNLSEDPVRIARTLLSGAGPVTLVLDAYEHLGDGMAEIDQDLARLILAEPELRLVITTRCATALVDLDLPDGVVRLVTARDLAMTTAEIGELISGQTGIHDERLVTSVAKATGGFALTVRAVTLALSQLGHIPNVGSMEWESIVVAKLESLLWDPVALEFLTDTSVPPYVDAELGMLLSGNSDALELFTMLERNGFGRWIPYSNRRQVFQYVETIRDSFRTRALRDPDRFRKACATTAIWLLGNEEIVDQALQFAIEAGDYALADRVFVSLVVTNPASYISDRFLVPLQRVPESVLCDYPMLAFGLALALMANPILRGESPRIARIAAESTARPSYLEPAIDEFSVASMQAIAYRLAGDYRTSAEEAAAVVRSIEPGLTEPPDQWAEHVGTVLRQLSYSLFQGGKIDAAMENINRSVALCRRQTIRDYSTVYAAGIQAFAGNLTRAKTLAAAVDTEAWPVELRHSYLNGLGLIAQGYGCLDAFDFQGALDIARTAESYLPTAEFWCFFAGIAVSARHGAGQAGAVADWLSLELAGPVPPPGVGDNVGTERLRAVHALAWMAAGDYREAARVLERTPESAYTAGARLSLLLGAGRYRDARQHASLALESPDHTIRTRAETRTIGAVAALRTGDTEQAWSWLNAAAVSWETYGVRLHVAMLTPSDRRLLWDFGCERDSVSLQRYLDVSASELVPERRAPVALTPRENTVLAALAEHSTNRAIANALVVSPHTVKTQLQSIYRKLGVSSRRSALAVARESGLLTPE